MELLVKTMFWMTYNSALAVVPVLLSQIALRIHFTLLRSIILFAWLIFLPNSIYLILDIVHLVEDFPVADKYQGIIVGMYMALMAMGLVTYYLALSPIEHQIKKRYPAYRLLFVIIINLAVGIGLVLGSILRVNSWDVLLNPIFLFDSLMEVYTSQLLTAMVIIFTVCTTVIYLSIDYLFKKRRLKKRTRR